MSSEIASSPPLPPRRESRLISSQAPKTASTWAAAITVEAALTTGRFSD